MQAGGLSRVGRNQRTSGEIKVMLIIEVTRKGAVNQFTQSTDRYFVALSRPKKGEWLATHDKSQEEGVKNW